MVRAFFAAALAVFLSVVPATADWTAPKDSVYRLDLFGLTDSGAVEPLGTCTTWRAQRTIYVTAAHCVEDVYSWQVNGHQAFYAGEDPDNDLAALYISPADLDGPSLKVSSVDPKVGDEVMGYGWGLALSQPIVSANKVSNPVLIDPNFGNRAWMMFFGNFVPGMSGGPVFNQKGEVISVVQAGGNPASELQDLGFGAVIAKVRAFVAHYR